MSYFTSTTAGIVLSQGTQNPATLVAGSYVTNTTPSYSGDAVYGTSLAAWDFTNFGTIKATATASAGVSLAAGGTVTNAATALISGVLGGVAIFGAAGTVSNSGALQGTGTSGIGVYLQAGGTIVNGATNVTSVLISGGYYGVYIGGATGAITNYGTIKGTASAGIVLRAVAGAGTVSNSGTIQGEGTGTHGDGILLTSAAAAGINNEQGALISGGYDGIAMSGTAGTVSNLGTIEGTGTSGDGIFLDVTTAGGGISNAPGALISGGFDGVALLGTAGTVSNSGMIQGLGSSGAGVALLGVGGGVSNFGTIQGTGPDSVGIFLEPGAADSSITNFQGALISGLFDGVDLYGAAGTVSNLGTIMGTDPEISSGIYMKSGTVVNGAPTITSALISGQMSGVDLYGSAGVVSNFGTIVGAGSVGAGVYLKAGGTVVNNASGLLSGYYDGVFVNGTTTDFGTVTNLGNIEGYGARSDGVRLSAVGGVTNELGGLISGLLNGVEIDSIQGRLSNYGTISGTGTHGAGAYLFAGGTVVNNAGALLSGTYDGAFVSGNTAGAYGFVTNLGTISGIGTHSVGARLLAGGRVDNEAGALLSGTYDGAFVSGTTAGGYGVVSNLGTIEGTVTGADGVRLAAYGYVTNQLGGLIRGALDGVEIDSSSGTMSNFGTIVGTNAVFMNAGTAINGAVTVTSALISGVNDGVTIAGSAGGTVGNFGTILGMATYGDGVIAAAAAGAAIVSNAAGALIAGGFEGVYLAGTSGTVGNLGTIEGLGANGDGIVLAAVAGTGIVSNSGTVEATGTNGDGIFMAAVGANVTNGQSGLISGGFDGIFIYGSGTVSNSGRIQGLGASGAGIVLAPAAAGASVTNAQSGRISGGYSGVEIYGDGTVSNLGTITSTTAVDMTSGTVVNGAATVTSALVSGVNSGVKIGGAAGGMVGNYGTIQGTGTDSNGISLAAAGGSVVGNAPGALISGGANGISISGSGTVANSGTIRGMATYGDGVIVAAAAGAAIVRNAAGALIAGGFEGVYLAGTYGTVGNLGTIRGAGANGAGIDLAAAAGTGIVSNTGTIEATGTNGDGIRLAASGASISNALGALISGGFDGIFVYGSGTVNNLGRIQGLGGTGAGILLASGAGGASVTNAQSGLISGGYKGVAIYGDGTVSNYGTITSTTAVDMTSGTVVNGAATVTSALILGVINGVSIHGGGFVSNYGEVVATATYGVGIYLSYGSVSNAGTVTAGTNGIGISVFGGQVSNSGTIVAEGSSAKAVVVRYGTFFNNGVVVGSVYGIEVSPGTSSANSGTVNVAGTVSGTIGIKVVPSTTVSQTVTVSGSVTSTVGTTGNAVSLGGGNNRLIVAPGAAFTGIVDGGGGASVLEIAATAGAAAGRSGPGMGLGGVTYVTLGSVVNFSAAQVDPSATFGGSGVISFDTVVNEGQINVGPGASLSIVVSASGAGVIDLEQGGAIDFKGAVAGQTLMFQPPGGTAAIDQLGAFGGTLSGFASPLDIVDLTTLSPNGATATLNTISNQLVVSNPTQSVTLQLDTGTDYSAVVWQTGTDSGTGTDVTPVCFCRGTLILTDAGEVAVEDLAVGDRVVTLSGSVKPITWIGFGRDLVTRRNSLARPVIVRAGALADEVPRRDLHLTHGHALYVDGALIPVENLVNHRSILWDEAARVVEYYHIELADHDVVFAEGAPAESYYDSGNRALFHNARAGSAAGAAKPTCAPVLNAGEAVERVWAELFARAGGLIERNTTDDPDLHLVVDGARLDPVSREDALYTFALAGPPTGPLLLASRSAVPSLIGLGRHDHRRLGIAIRQVILHAPGVMTSLDHDGPVFAAGGCHLPEGGHAWTDGELALPPSLFAHLRGPFTLIVHTNKQAMRYPIATAVCEAAA